VAQVQKTRFRRGWLCGPAVENSASKVVGTNEFPQLFRAGEFFAGSTRIGCFVRTWAAWAPRSNANVQGGPSGDQPRQHHVAGICLFAKFNEVAGDFAREAGGCERKSTAPSGKCRCLQNGPNPLARGRRGTGRQEHVPQSQATGRGRASHRGTAVGEIQHGRRVPGRWRRIVALLRGEEFLVRLVREMAFTRGPPIQTRAS